MDDMEESNWMLDALLLANGKAVSESSWGTGFQMGFQRVRFALGLLIHRLAHFAREFLKALPVPAERALSTRNGSGEPFLFEPTRSMVDKRSAAISSKGATHAQPEMDGLFVRCHVSASRATTDNRLCF